MITKGKYYSGLASTQAIAICQKQSVFKDLDHIFVTEICVNYQNSYHGLEAVLSTQSIPRT